jgi:hypothetical protein
MASDWSRFAWQGIQIETPRDWELGAVTGDRRKGYFRLDDAEMPRLEARWQAGASGRAALRSRLNEEPIAAVAERYLKEAGLAGPKGEKQVARHVDLQPPAGVDAEFFVTRGHPTPRNASPRGAGEEEPNAVHMAVRCRDCGRVALLRLFCRRDEPDLAHLFSSYRDHALGGKMPWALFGLRFEVPKEYSLLRHSLRAGRVELEFACRRVRALAARVALAETVLRKESLLEWVKRDSAGPWPVCDQAFGETTRGDHAAVAFHGRERSLAGRMLGRLRAARGLAWHCDPSNALYIARWFGLEESVPEFAALAESFLCHEAGL